MFSTLRRYAGLLALAILAILAVGLTGFSGHAQGVTGFLFTFSAYGIALGGVGFVVVAWYLIDRSVLGHFDTWVELEEGNEAVARFAGAVFIAFAIIFLGAVSAFGQPVGSAGFPSAHVDTAATYLGVTEEPPGSNRGAAVERFLSEVGLSGGYPYCAAAVSAWANWAGVSGPPAPGAEAPIRTALATDFLDSPCSISAGDVLRGERPPPGSIVVWQKGNSIYGHAGVVTGDEAAPDSARTAWWGRCGRTIEANTTPGPASTAAERDGGGVWRRVRCIRPHSYFRIVGFVSPTC